MVSYGQHVFPEITSICCARFHYPELAVLFDITEEDTYKFCMRTRMDSSKLIMPIECASTTPLGGPAPPCEGNTSFPVGPC